MFIITHDYISGPEPKRVAICGPSTITTEDATKLDDLADGKSIEGSEHFYMYDDDGERCYAGYYLDAYGSDVFEPLDCYGAGSAGCTSIKMRNSEGKYTTV